MKIIGLSSDHNGILLKKKIRNYLKDNNFVVVDIGPFDENRKVDYDLIKVWKKRILIVIWFEL